MSCCSSLRSASLLLSILLLGCQPASQQKPEEKPEADLVTPDLTGATPWTDLSIEDASSDFHFAIVSDRTCCARPGVFASAMPKVNLLSPAFVVSVGDLIEGYTENQATLNKEWNEVETMVGSLDAPFFYTPGNHDMNNAVMANEWLKRFGPSYYHFKYKDVLFVVLNSELFGMVGAPDTPVPGPWKQAEQMEFVRSILAQNPDVRWTIVLLHQPLWDSPRIDEDWLEVEGLLGERNYTVFAGHFHQYSRVRRHDRNYITLATTGGGSGLRGSAYGEFDHVAWVTMRDAGPTIANVTLDGILDEDVSNPELRGGLNDIGLGIALPHAFNTGEVFTESTQPYSITNPTDDVMSVTPSVARASSFDVDGLVPLTLQPGETKEGFLKLTSSEPTPYSQLTAAAVQWTVTGTVAERMVQFPVVKPLLPLSRHTIEKAGDLNVDGDLSDWGALRFAALSQGDAEAPQTDAQDISLTFDVREGDETLFIAVNVVDDDVVEHADLIPRMQDSVRIFVDPREAAVRDVPMGAGAAVLGGDMAAQVATILPVGAHTADELLGFVDVTNANIEYQVVRTEEGYVVEVGIPLAYIASKAAGGETWQEARIAVGAYDLDSGDHGPKALHWGPYRHASTALPGSGTFVRLP